MQILTTSNTASKATAMAGILLIASSAPVFATQHSKSNNTHQTKCSGEYYQDLARAQKSGNVWIKYQEKNDTSHSQIISTKEQIEVIIGSLGLGMTDLQKVMRVQRATLYNWKKGGDVKGDDSLTRLNSVYSIAKKVNEFNTQPFGRITKTHTLKGKTYLQQLSEDNLNTSDIVDHARALSKIANNRRVATDSSNGMNDIDNISGSLTIYERS
ncbi:hypothetical protein C9J41_17825 [Photobacterium sp. GB-50]|uniref:hypothetical protein n=1 Tax=Photobacterium sp. GB-50 TaxID=2022107 RepID=UPI000D159D33|nr:hypothetical protein [Photobacterium sp. GB-50]PSW72176.1 hypothetical protein C9J41_17825 [Photobacterium sp. GB-50]